MDKFWSLLWLLSLCTGSMGLSAQCLFLDLRVEREGKDGDFKYSEMVQQTPSEDTDSIKHIASELRKPGEVVTNGVAYCSSELSSCFSMWKYDHVNGSRRPLKQGCWNNPDEKHTCDSVTPEATCVGHPIVNNSTFFCCCRGNLCNDNLTEGTFQLSSDFLEPKTDLKDFISNDYRNHTITIALSSISGLAAIIVIIFLVYRLRCLPRDGALTDPFYLGEPPSAAPPLFIMDDLRTTDLIQRGRFGTVWKGELSAVPVAVKVFTASQRSYYNNEEDIFLLPHMAHVSLPRFYGTGERLTLDGGSEHVIVMEYIQRGSLMDYLSEHTLDWTTLCNMIRSAAAGLAHLHADFTKPGMSKPAIAHRDFNSRNVMVRADLSCCLVDFGFAMRIDGCHFYRNGQEENAEQTSLSDVGTIRYMSPEVLEGAVNLRDCEASLKQIDVYALGLVIWEMAMRCSDLFQGLASPEYQLPFQAELGLHPSFEQMQVWVSRNKRRPPFPEIWKDTNQAVRALKETMEDCWDADAEARLTAMCVEERAMDMASTLLLLLQSRKQAHKGGLTPTMGQLEEKGLIQRNVTDDVPPLIQPPPPPPPPPSGPPEANERMQQELSLLDDSIETISPPALLDDAGGINIPLQHRSLIYGRVSTQPTCPSADPQRLLQHRGQNPTVARNTHKHSDEELSVQGNTLVGSKAPSAHVTSHDLISAFADTWDELLPSGPASQSNHLVLPAEVVVRPKQPNLPIKDCKKRKNGFLNFFKPRKPSQLLLLQKPEQQLIAAENSPSPVAPDDEHEEEIAGKSNLAPRVSTQVCLVNSGGALGSRAVVRPLLNSDWVEDSPPSSGAGEQTTQVKSPVAMETGDWRHESQQRNLFHPVNAAAVVIADDES